MNMSEVITRINVLAKKAKTEGLTAEETAERDKLRRIYIDSVKANLVGQLDNTYVLQPDGTKKKLERGGDPEAGWGNGTSRRSGRNLCLPGSFLYCLRRKI